MCSEDYRSCVTRFYVSTRSKYRDNQSYNRDHFPKSFLFSIHSYPIIPSFIVVWFIDTWTVRGSNPGTDKRLFSLPNVHTGFGIHPALIQWALVLSTGAERPECEADHQPLSSAKVKNELSYTSTPTIYETSRWKNFDDDDFFLRSIRNTWIQCAGRM
jgi:hypothetical protein